MCLFQPGVGVSNIEVHNQWLQQVKPLCDSFSFPGYPSQTPMKIHT